MAECIFSADSIKLDKIANNSPGLAVKQFIFVCGYYFIVLGNFPFYILCVHSVEHNLML